MKTDRRSPGVAEPIVPSDLLARILAVPDAARILIAFARATGLTVALEEVCPSPGGHGPPCGGMSRLGPRRISECVERRTGLLGRVAETGSSAAIGCPVGTFCLPVPVYALGSQVATLRAGGFTRKMGASKKRADAVRELLLLAADELGHHAASQLAHPRSGSAAVNRAMCYLLARSGKPLHVQEVAAAAGVSRQHLTKIWKSHVGISLHAYLNAIRIDRAKVLLEAESQKIIDTAMECGFGSLSQFNRAFLRATGVPPSRWITRHR
ncbi:MAG: AraC family transcriptional regulator [Verrucomicrobiota bacterium]